MSPLVACLDANVYISAMAFGGIPLKILQRALRREFQLVAGPPILNEVRRNLVGKLGLDTSQVDPVLDDFQVIASMFMPTGTLRYITHAKDDLVLEIALLGQCDVLVTGDKKHLLPLGRVRGMAIEAPSYFLTRLDDSRR